MSKKVLKAVDKFYSRFGYFPVVEAGVFYDYPGIAILKEDGSIFTIVYPFLN